MTHKTRTAALLCAAALAAAALTACAPNKQSSAAQPTDAPTTSESVATTAPPVQKTAEDYVETVREYNIDYHGTFLLTGETDYHPETGSVARMPQLTLNSADAQAINSEIHEKLDSIFDRYPNADYITGRTDYVCYLNGNLLSLVIESRSTDTPNSGFTVYNINVDTGSRLSNEEIVSAAGISAEEVRTALAADINARCDEGLAGLTREDLVSQMERAREASLAEDNLANAACFFDGDGALNVTYRYKWIAGAENYGALLVTGYHFKG